jgi:hypothetical protein
MAYLEWCWPLRNSASKSTGPLKRFLNISIKIPAAPAKK